MNKNRSTVWIAIGLAIVMVLAGGCEYIQQPPDTERTTDRDKTKKGAAIGAASGAVLGALLGEGELDEILAGAAIGAGIGAGIGVYMDKQEEKLAQIPGTTVERVDEDKLLVHFESDILFEVDSSELSVTAMDTLSQAATVFAEFPKTAIIAQGHTDSTGTDDYNQRLSERRAISVRSYLTSQGIDYARILAEGYGESYPVADNSTEAGRSRNRRVDLLIKGKAK
jgi:outer membrane protein OmpA-like peptidoglycan-associated protein